MVNAKKPWEPLLIRRCSRSQGSEKLQGAGLIYGGSGFAARTAGVSHKSCLRRRWSHFRDPFQEVEAAMASRIPKVEVWWALLCDKDGQ